LALLIWGASYLIASLDDPNNAGRIADLNMFGSTTPISASLDWIALNLMAIAATSYLYRRGRAQNGGILVFLSICLVLIVAEGFVRAVRCIHPVVQGFPTYSSLLWSRSHVQLNRDGFRDGDHGSARDRNTYRLLVVGDSYAFGWGIRKAEDRFGERLAMKLHRVTGKHWESINASRPDTHTLHHLQFIEAALSHRPDLVVILYVFNDIDYLSSVTPREGQSEAPKSLLDYVDPARMAFRNSYLFQEFYVRMRLMLYSAGRSNNSRYDPYADKELMAKHFKDLSLLISRASESGAMAVVVPFEVSINADSNVRTRYENFVTQGLAAGIPIWTAEHAFDGYALEQLTVNALDRHPNEFANDLLAEAVTKQFSVVKRDLLSTSVRAQLP
jgi:hypothetical protein